MCKKPFAVSVKVVIRDKQDRCLLLRRSLSSKWNGGKWDFPGGKVDPHDTFEGAVFREVTEETGLRIRLGRVVGAAESETPTKRVAYVMFEGQWIDGKVELSSEHDEWVWVCPGDLAKMDICAQFIPFARTYGAMSPKASPPAVEGDTSVGD